MKQNIYKVFNHNKEYISKYIYDYDTMQEHTLDESEETNNIDRQIELLNENDKILKVFIEASFSDLLQFVNKKLNKELNNKYIWMIICISSFIFSLISTYLLNHSIDIPNIMCLIIFCISLVKILDKSVLKEIKAILESYKK